MATRDTYEVQEWEDLPSENTPISGERLGHIEQGISDAMNNRALKDIYSDTAISLGRKEDTFPGYHSATVGSQVTAYGNNSYAGGNGTTVNGNNSFVFGNGTIASGSEQHVTGRYNEEDYSTFAEIVGGGNPYGRKNIRTLDWNGNAMYAGTVESQGIILTDSATEQKYKLTVENGNIAITAIE